MTEQTPPPGPPGQPAPPPAPPAPPPAQPPAPAGKPIITYDDFAKLDLRVAKVLAVRDHPNADKLLVLDVDMGGQQRTIVAGLKPYYGDPQVLAGQTIILLTNIEPRKMRGIESNGMLLAASWGDGPDRRVTVLTTDPAAPPGSPIS